MGLEHDRIIYSLNVADLHNVATETLGRALSGEEIAVVERHVGDSIDWWGAIETITRFLVEPISHANN